MNKKRYFRTKTETLSRDLSSYAALYEFDTDKYKAKKKVCVLELDLEYLEDLYNSENCYLLAIRENLCCKRQTIKKILNNSV